jgi:hypothetical protein
MADFSKFSFANGLYRSRVIAATTVHLTTESLVKLCCLVSASYFKEFKVCKLEHHQTIQINQPTRYNNLSSLLLDFYLQLNMLRASSLPSSGATTTAVAASGFTVGAWR